MKIKILSRKVICSNGNCYDNYFAWPSLTRLKNGRLAMVSSGYMTSHLSPFGKGIMCLSEDEGETWTQPMIVMDAPLIRGCEGISTFGDQGVFINAFTRHMGSQRAWNEEEALKGCVGRTELGRKYIDAYLDVLENECDYKKYYGALHRISTDNGLTFSDYMQSPVINLHGNAELPDGTMLCVGNRVDAESGKHSENLSCYKMFADGSSKFLCEIEGITDEDGNTFGSAEPHTIVTRSGKVIVHIRSVPDIGFNIYQCESVDGGRSFTKPHRILPPRGGSPAHLLEDNGVLISTYGYREKPYGVRVMFSCDEGQSWDVDNVLIDDERDTDCGYPSSVVLNDGRILTVYYGKASNWWECVIKQVIWTYE